MDSSFPKELRHLPDYQRHKTHPQNDRPSIQPRILHPERIGQTGQVNRNEQQHRAERQGRPNVRVTGDFVLENTRVVLTHVEHMNSENVLGIVRSGECDKTGKQIGIRFILLENG